MTMRIIYTGMGTSPKGTTVTRYNAREAKARRAVIEAAKAWCKTGASAWQIILGGAFKLTREAIERGEWKEKKG